MLINEDKKYNVYVEDNASGSVLVIEDQLVPMIPTKHVRVDVLFKSEDEKYPLINNHRMDDLDCITLSGQYPGVRYRLEDLDYLDENLNITPKEPFPFEKMNPVDNKYESPLHKYATILLGRRFRVVFPPKLFEALTYEVLEETDDCVHVQMVINVPYLKDGEVSKLYTSFVKILKDILVYVDGNDNLFVGFKNELKQEDVEDMFLCKFAGEFHFYKKDHDSIEDPELTGMAQTYFFTDSAHFAYMVYEATKEHESFVPENVTLAGVMRFFPVFPLTISVCNDALERNIRVTMNTFTNIVPKGLRPLTRTVIEKYLSSDRRIVDHLTFKGVIHRNVILKYSQEQVDRFIPIDTSIFTDRELNFPASFSNKENIEHVM